ncbi:MAG: type II toxin-antitoxin system Phd/YefM family antitoxin [Campylobacterales bacterium]|nr:type II toxin-antitoxin system Phd/YefM family antitoxin [Campylobacterales bacterium]
MVVSPSKLRENLYNLLDAVIEKGESIEISRKGKILRIMPEQRPSRLAKIIPKTITTASDDALINTPWEGEWKPFI